MDRKEKIPRRSRELRKIKKLYGEDFMKMCRDNLSTILEKEGVLTEILTQTFATNSRTLFDDLMFSQGVGEKYEERIKKYVGSIEDFVGNIYSIYEAKY